MAADDEKAAALREAAMKEAADLLGRLSTGDPKFAASVAKFWAGVLDVITRDEAAEMLGVAPGTVYKKLSQFRSEQYPDGIEPVFRDPGQHGQSRYRRKAVEHVAATPKRQGHRSDLDG